MRDQLPLILTVAGLAYSGSSAILELLKPVVDQSLQAEWRVVSAAELIETARRERPALILIGHRPLSRSELRVWGGELIKALKSDPQLRPIPVLLFESLLNIEHVARESGADAYVELPMSPQHFSETIQRLLSVHTQAELHPAT
ncbi:MAG TPA: hypothetical protein VJG32_21475 [Anaerolineae bacterium]|nr:hypothetical protein [Anaerolineae bacterium]